MSLTVQLALGAVAFMVVAGTIMWRVTSDFDKTFGKTRSSRGM